MFAPTTYWEKRAALMESLTMQLITMMGGEQPEQVQYLINNWMAQNTAMKSRHANVVLGAISPEVLAQSASEPFIQAALQINFGPCLTEGVDLYEAPADALGQSKEEYDQWVQTLPDFHNDVNPDQLAPFFREVDPESKTMGVIMAFRVDDMIYVLSSGAYLNMMQLSLKHVEEGALLWRNGRFRAELFEYRGDLTRSKFAIALGNALKSIGKTEVRLPPLPDEELENIQSVLADTIRVERIDPVIVPPKPEPPKQETAETPSEETPETGDTSIPAEGSSDEPQA